MYARPICDRDSEKHRQSTSVSWSTLAAKKVNLTDLLVRRIEDRVDWRDGLAQLKVSLLVRNSSVATQKATDDLTSFNEVHPEGVLVARAGAIVGKDGNIV